MAAWLAAVKPHFNPSEGFCHARTAPLIRPPHGFSLHVRHQSHVWHFVHIWHHWLLRGAAVSMGSFEIAFPFTGAHDSTCLPPSVRSRGRTHIFCYLQGVWGGNVITLYGRCYCVSSSLDKALHGRSSEITLVSFLFLCLQLRFTYSSMLGCAQMWFCYGHVRCLFSRQLLKRSFFWLVSDAFLLVMKHVFGTTNW